MHRDKTASFNVDAFNRFKEDSRITLDLLIKEGMIAKGAKAAKVLGHGELKKKLEFEGFLFSASAKEKIEKAGGTIIG